MSQVEDTIQDRRSNLQILTETDGINDIISGESLFTSKNGLRVNVHVSSRTIPPVALPFEAGRQAGREEKKNNRAKGKWTEVNPRRDAPQER